jgi:DNA-binding MarR family transcriptional regulator
MSFDRFPEGGCLPEYDDLAALLLSRLSATLPLLDFWMLEKNEQRVGMAVCRSTGITLDRWDILTLPERVPYLEATIESLSAHTKLTSTQYGVLQQLARHSPRLIKITDLAADLDCDRSAASEAIQHLKQLGYVERPSGPRSGIGITERGSAALRPCDRPKPR